MSKPKPDRRGLMRGYGLGFEFAAAVAGFGLVGFWIDTSWDCSPVGVLVGVGLGLIGATYNLIRASQAAFRPPSTKDEKEENEKDP